MKRNTLEGHARYYNCCDVEIQGEYFSVISVYSGEPPDTRCNAKMKTYAIWGAVILMAVSPATARAAEEPWKEVRSPHFRVLTNGTAGEAREVARELEQMREVFVLEYPKFRLESGAPLPIFAARDEETAKNLVPPLKKSPQGWMVAGLYRHGWEKNYAVVRLDSWGQGAHETISSRIHALDPAPECTLFADVAGRGAGEFFAYTRFQGDKIYVGAATERYKTLPSPSIPIEALISQRGSFQHSEYGTQMFYLESWALVHLMTFGPGMDNGAKLSRFYALLQKGEDQKKAFEEAFGDVAAMDKALGDYMGHLAFTAGVLNNPVHFDEKQFPARTMGPAESEATIAEAELALGGRDAARPWVEQALRDDPNLGLAHEDSGFVLFADGNDEAPWHSSRGVRSGPEPVPFAVFQDDAFACREVGQSGGPRGHTRGFVEGARHQSGIRSCRGATGIAGAAPEKSERRAGALAES